jgi:hypothetical protein
VDANRRPELQPGTQFRMTKLMRCDDTGACMFDVSTGSGSIIIWSPDDPIPEDLDRKLFQSGREILMI